MVYCLEAVDLPDGVRVGEIYLPEDFQPEARFASDLLGGVTVLEGQAFRDKNADWNGTLYKRGTVRDLEPVQIRLIPYFTWHNRGNEEMAVWLPLA
jgi:DUF1680 family protein